MRTFLVLVLTITFLGSAYGIDLGNVSKDIKDNSHVGMNPGTPDGREGGEDMASAVVIAALPFQDTGNTYDNIHDYEVSCPYGSTSPDVVYSYIPDTGEVISVDLCGSGYDTKTFILDGAMNVIACNDDFYFDDTCGTYVSLIEEAYLDAGTEYFIVIDGYGGDSGDYTVVIDVFTPDPPCVLTCSGLPEYEPALGPNYDDAFNGGCNSPEFGNPYLDLTWAGDSLGELTFCGISGWYDYSGSSHRDTDWMYFAIGEYGMIEWVLDAEQPCYGFLLGGDCDSGITVDDQITGGPCAPSGTMVVQGTPGDVVTLWVGPTEYGPPAGFVGYEFNYIATFTGLYPGETTATEKVSFGQVKSLFR